jgi:hypothetical protein
VETLEEKSRGLQLVEEDKAKAEAVCERLREEVYLYQQMEERERVATRFFSKHARRCMADLEKEEGFEMQLRRLQSFEQAHGHVCPALRCTWPSDAAPSGGASSAQPLGSWVEGLRHLEMFGMLAEGVVH